MDEEFQSLEDELKRLLPRAPTMRLEKGIASDLVGPATDRRSPAGSSGFPWWRWMAGLGAGGALAAVLVFVTHEAAQTPTEKAEVASELKTAAVSDDLDVQVSEIRWDKKDLGILVVEDRPPVRVVNYQKLTSIRWSDAAGRTTTEWMLPSEETEFIPAVSRSR